MTSVASYGLASTLGNHTLSIGSSPVGDWIESWTCRPARLVDPQPNTCFWSSIVSFDGQYPTLIWEHTVRLYVERANRYAYAQAIADLTTNYRGSATAMKIFDSNSTVIASLGDCYLQGPITQDEPDALLMHAAGFVTLQLLGSAKPTISTSPLT